MLRYLELLEGNDSEEEEEAQSIWVQSTTYEGSDWEEEEEEVPSM